jgi:class 3 adenylate cyclase
LPQGLFIVATLKTKWLRRKAGRLQKGVAFAGSERKLVTVLFSDLSGYSTLCQNGWTPKMFVK